jgi:hypothetical protein
MVGILNRIAPAAAQRFKNLAPAVWNAAKEGVVQGAKNGVKSLLRPTAKSKYLSVNSITNLAHPPGGNIQALIDENIAAAQKRQGSNTAFLNSIIGKNRVQGIQKAFQQKNTTRRSSSPPAALWNMKTRKRFEELAAQKMPNRGEDPMPIPLKNVEEQAENPTQMMGGRRRRGSRRQRASSKSRSTRRRRAASRQARPSSGQ